MRYRRALLRAFVWSSVGLLFCLLASPFAAASWLTKQLLTVAMWPYRFALDRTKAALDTAIEQHARMKAIAEEFKRRHNSLSNSPQSDALRSAIAVEKISSANQFRPGDKVKWVPYHAQGDADHPDCDLGVVSSISATGNVFVRFRSGTDEACNPINLLPVQRVD